MHASSDRWLRVATALLVATVLGLAAASARAHKASDSYLQIDARAQGLDVRWDIALRDLDAALDLDRNEDGRLTWGEIRAAWPRIDAYALGRLEIAGCPLKFERHALERRNDGAYAALFLSSACTLAAAPRIHYSLLADVDPTHRGIARIVRPGAALVVTVLDPTAASEAPPSATGRPASATTGSIETAAPARAARAASPSAGANPGSTSGPAASTGGFLAEGVRHILTGYDHVLFLLCLLLPSVMKRTPLGWRPVERLSQALLPIAGIVTAFTVAHSITLALAALQLVSLPAAFVEPAIAVTIILAALDNVWPIFPVRRVVVTFIFGLIHGFGFAGVLAELELPTRDFAFALLQFNVGLELGQLLIVVCVTAVLFLVRERPQYRRWVIGGGSYAAIVVGVLWLIERTANVSLLPV